MIFPRIVKTSSNFNLRVCTSWLLTFIVSLLFLTQSCNKSSKEKSLFVPLKGGLRFTPESNCLYADSTKKAIQKMIARGASFDSVVLEARKLIAKDTMLMARDSLLARVRVVVTSAVGGFGARVNGIEVGTSEKKIPIFPDSICFWINAYGTQGKLEGNIFINGKKKDFEFKEYDPMTDATVKFSLKDFKEALPRKKKPALEVPLVQKDSILARN